MEGSQHDSMQMKKTHLSFVDQQSFQSVEEDDGDLQFCNRATKAVFLEGVSIELDRMTYFTDRLEVMLFTQSYQLMSFESIECGGAVDSG